MTNLELFLASQIRALAVDLRGTARAEYYAAVFSTSTDDERRIKLAEWDRENPIETFVPIALAELEDIASVVAKLSGDQALP